MSEDQKKNKQSKSSSSSSGEKTSKTDSDNPVAVFCKKCGFDSADTKLTECPHCNKKLTSRY